MIVDDISKNRALIRNSAPIVVEANPLSPHRFLIGAFVMFLGGFIAAAGGCFVLNIVPAYRLDMDAETHFWMVVAGYTTSGLGISIFAATTIYSFCQFLGLHKIAHNSHVTVLAPARITNRLIAPEAASSRVAPAAPASPTLSITSSTETHAVVPDMQDPPARKLSSTPEPFGEEPRRVRRYVIAM